MREIKFRAWEENNGMLYLEDMLIGCGHETASSWSSIDIHGKLVTKMSNFHEDPKPNSSLLEWMQYTGLKDKNGVEIYEGDICTFNDYGEYFSERYDEDADELVADNAYEVYWGGAGWWIRDKSEPHGKNMEYSPFYDGMIIEVIGNIYENPELLKETT